MSSDVTPDVDEWVEATAVSRLHFGLLSVNATGTRRFGGLGMMVDAPRCLVRLRRAHRDTVLGAQPERVRAILERLRSTAFRDEHAAPEDNAQPRTGSSVTGSQPPSSGVCIHVCEMIPPHCGFGSGTQLALAIAQGFHVLWRGLAADPVRLSQWTGRGARSAIGTHGAAWGGLLVDGGRRGDTPAPLIARLAVPPQWRMVLVCPRTPGRFCGSREQSAFQALPAMESSLTGRLCSLAMLEILPALAESDFEGFSRGLDEYGQLVGEYFAPVQGGLVSAPEMSTLIEVLRQRGHHGIGQSSWGPAIWVCAASQQHAREIAGEIVELIDAAHWTVTVSSPCNLGMQLRRGSWAELQAGVGDRLEPREPGAGEPQSRCELRHA